MSAIQSVSPRTSGLIALVELSTGQLVEITRNGERLLVDGREVAWLNLGLGEGAPDGDLLEFNFVQHGRHPR